MQHSVAAAEKVLPTSPLAANGAWRWLRQNLFSNWWNTLLTILVVYLLIQIVPPLLDWMVFSAVWTHEKPEVCRQASGACWAFIHEKYRLMLFGRYPYEEQWRPLLAMIVLIGTLLFSCNKNYWKPWLLAVWAWSLLLFFLLMWGDVLGMPYVDSNLWGGLPLTLMLSVLGIAVAFPLGILLALGRRSKMPVIRMLCIGYIEMIRGVPLISLLFVASFVLPLFLPTGVNFDAVLRAQVAIIMFSAAYLAEVIRGGLQAIPKGQYEAAAAMGLGYWLSMRKIILPQAIRLVIPPIVNTFIGLFKDTSLVSIVSLTDFLLAVQVAIADAPWRPFYKEGYVFAAFVYFVFCYAMSKYSQYLERQFETGRQKRR
jgi:general L-amino acid transport system permease protein